MKLPDYQVGLAKWADFNLDMLSLEEKQKALQDAFAHCKNPNHLFWLRSKQYYEVNISQILEGKSSIPADDEYLRTFILPLLPKHNRTSIPPSEVKTNWNNSDWWYENFADLLYLLDNMYVKKTTRDYLKQHKRTRGPYTSWLMRIIQYINTQEGEFFLPTIIPYLIIDKIAHDSIHAGVATEAEQQPDFTMTDGRKAELKICSTTYLEVFRTQLRDNFDNVKRDDFHNADGGLFITKEPIPRLFSVDLSSYEAAQVIRERPEFDLSGLHLILTDDRGHIDFKDWPALPCAFLFGFVASWLKE